MRIVLLAACIVAAFTLMTEAEAGNWANLDDSGLALHGYDPVSYHTGEPHQGSSKLMLSHEGVTYLFSKRDNMRAFEADPQRYLPAYGGWCAWAMLEGEMVDVDPERFKIVSGKTYLFYNSFFSDTLKKWDELAEEESEEVLIAEADRHWSAIRMQ